MEAKKILLVEDDEKLIANLADKLRAEGYDVSTALDGESGWQMARANAYDLIVLDIMLTGLDGLSLCRMIRRDSAASDVSIIMLTARGAEVDKIVGLESGADDYIVKPFGLGEFLARVRVQMRRPSPERGLNRQERTSGDLRLDFTRQTRLSRRRRNQIEQQGIRPLDLAHAQPERRAIARFHPGKRLGPRLFPHGQANGRCAYSLAARKNRRRALQPQTHQHRARRRLSLRGLTMELLLLAAAGLFNRLGSRRVSPTPGFEGAARPYPRA